MNEASSDTISDGGCAVLCIIEVARHCVVGLQSQSFGMYEK